MGPATLSQAPTARELPLARHPGRNYAPVCGATLCSCVTLTNVLNLAAGQPHKCWRPDLWALNEARQQDQHGSHRDGASDPSRNLGERHKLHPVGSGENCDVAGAALSAVARVDDGRLDRVPQIPAGAANAPGSSLGFWRRSDAEAEGGPAIGQRTRRSTSMSPP
jgi:hypothetical protein